MVLYAAVCQNDVCNIVIIILFSTLVQLRHIIFQHFFSLLVNTKQ